MSTGIQHQVQGYHVGRRVTATNQVLIAVKPNGLPGLELTWFSMEDSVAQAVSQLQCGDLVCLTVADDRPLHIMVLALLTRNAL